MLASWLLRRNALFSGHARRVRVGGGWFGARAYSSGASTGNSSEFKRFLDGTTTDKADYPLCDDVVKRVLVYDCRELGHEKTWQRNRHALQAELGRALVDGPGVVVLRGAYAAPLDGGIDTIDEATEAYDEMMMIEKTHQSSGGDHFGANRRLWNAHQKLCIMYPRLFAQYYQNRFIALIGKAYLGPMYQMTSQVNDVVPGSIAQQPHLDYHLGFHAEPESMPLHSQKMSSFLTLQGAVAHTDMPLESGPTMFLPHSHKFEHLYMTWRRPEFQQVFEQQHVQVALEKGDAVFFSPAVMHGAGANRTSGADSQHRFGNLLQMSSCFGRAMESVDRYSMVKSLYPILAETCNGIAQEDLDQWDRSGALEGIDNVLASAAEGYAFPTNLDLEPPTRGGLPPPSQYDIVRTALQRRLSLAEFEKVLSVHASRRSAMSGVLLRPHLEVQGGDKRCATASN